MFIAGADQAYIEGEGLRSPTLRGLMRWWFRAIMGGLVDEGVLYEKESEIFGSTNTRSKVRILTNIIDGQPIRIDVKALNDFRYLWFSIRMQALPDRAQHVQRPFCYPSGSKFSITLKSEDVDALKIAANTLWTMIYLGGVGARMRRGAGSFRVFRAENAGSYCNFTFKGTVNADAKSFLENNLKTIFDNFRNKYKDITKPSREPTFCVLSRKTAEIALINKAFVRYEDALREVSDVYQQFRSGIKFGRKTALGIPRQERVVFGLPIQRLCERERLRQASPLHIGVMKIDEKYAIRLVKFYTSIHPRFPEKSLLLKQHLNSLNTQLKRRFPIIEQIEIPEVK